MIILAFAGISIQLSAQTPYSGGSGDGYAFASLELSPVATTHDVVHEISLFPSPAISGKPIQISSERQMGRVIMYTVNGTMIQSLLPAGNSNAWMLPNVTEGMYILSIYDMAGTLYYARLVITGF